MQDQMGFKDDKEQWYVPSNEVPSNHTKRYKKHGEWVFPVFPTNISLQGSINTPYIYEDRCDPKEVANLAVFMCSNCGSMIMGDTIYMTGGNGLF